MSYHRPLCASHPSNQQPLCVSHTLTVLRQTTWISKGRTAVKRIIQKDCFHCKRNLCSFSFPSWKMSTNHPATTPLLKRETVSMRVQKACEWTCTWRRCRFGVVSKNFSVRESTYSHHSLHLMRPLKRPFRYRWKLRFSGIWLEVR